MIRRWCHNLSDATLLPPTPFHSAATDIFLKWPLWPFHALFQQPVCRHKYNGKSFSLASLNPPAYPSWPTHGTPCCGPLSPGYRNFCKGATHPHPAPSPLNPSPWKTLLHLLCQLNFSLISHWLPTMPPPRLGASSSAISHTFLLQEHFTSTEKLYTV